VREGISLAAGSVLFCTVMTIAMAMDAGETVHLELARPLTGVTVALTVDSLGLLFAIVASFLWIVTTVYAIGYMRGHHEKNQTRFYAFFAIAIACVMGIAFAGNMLTLFVFYEALTISTFPLVTHAGTPEARKAGRTYLGILLGTSIGFQMIAIIGTYALTGTLDFRVAAALRLWRRQSCPDAIPSLAARRHGCPHAGQRASPRRGRGQGRCLYGAEGCHLHLRF
jgi:multicomponent Na+:H+ antiporter subunit D